MPINITKPYTNSHPMDFLSNVIEKQLGGHIYSCLVENPQQTLHTLGDFKITTIPAGPASIKMEVAFPLPLKSKESLSDLELPSPPPKVIKEKLTDEEVIERYHKIMEEKAEKNKENDPYNDWVDIEI